MNKLRKYISPQIYKKKSLKTAFMQGYEDGLPLNIDTLSLCCWQCGCGSDCNTDYTGDCNT